MASRTESRELILSGKVFVNGVVCKNPEKVVSLRGTQLEITGVETTGSQTSEEVQPHILVLNKTSGLVTTKRDEKNRPTVYTLLPPEWQKLHPVGRLDQATTGLLLFTNSTTLSHFLTDPKNAIPRKYLVTVRGEVTKSVITQMETGVWVKIPQSGSSAKETSVKLQVSSALMRKVSRRESHLMITLVEGKNREIRRLLAHFGYEVTALKRIQFGPFVLGDLPSGQFRLANDQEQKAVRDLIAVYGERPSGGIFQ